MTTEKKTREKSQFTARQKPQFDSPVGRCGDRFPQCNGQGLVWCEAMSTQSQPSGARARTGPQGSGSESPRDLGIGVIHEASHTSNLFKSGSWCSVLCTLYKWRYTLELGREYCRCLITSSYRGARHAPTGQAVSQSGDARRMCGQAGITYSSAR